MASFYANHSKDLYKILQIPHTATRAEIKGAYRKLALELHPDTTDGCEVKLDRFKQVNEAYSILVDPSQRRAYDVQRGHMPHREGTKAHPGFNRKVYAPRPPPNWKTVWDHARHYEMHYGDGMKEEAIRMARKAAQKEGLFDYHSPLGKGFVFEKPEKNESSTTTNNVNPYSKHSPQGPPKVVFEYEEGVSWEGGKPVTTQRERIVEDLYARRDARTERRKRQSPPPRQRSPVYDTYPASFATAATNDDNENSCVIL